MERNTSQSRNVRVRFTCFCRETPIQQATATPLRHNVAIRFDDFEGRGTTNAPGVLAQLPAQPLQAFAALLLLRIFDPAAQGGLRVPLRDLPGPDDVPAGGHRLARR